MHLIKVTLKKLIIGIEMKDDIHCEEISSLIDGEINEAKKKEEITEKINNDAKLKFEFLTLKL